MGAYTGGGPDLVWYGAAGDRTKTSISGFGILDEFRGVLVRDDYGGYTSYDDDLAGVQQCLSHVLRYLDDAHAIDTDAQAWARQVDLGAHQLRPLHLDAGHRRPGARLVAAYAAARSRLPSPFRC